MNPVPEIGSPEYRIGRAANWLYWIAGLSIINTISALSGGKFGFFFGLGITQAIDGIGGNVHTSTGKAICLAADGLVFAYFVAMGYFGRRNRWLFTAGFLAYALDSLICVFFQDWLGLALHAFALFAMVGGYKGFRELEHARQATLASTGAPIQ